jgi:GNAT superfamily N-acetyltransferase
MVDMAERHGRRLLFSNTSSRVPAGEFFMNAIGAQKALESHVNRLLIADLNRDLVAAWVREAPTNLYELDFWDGPYPEAELDNVIALHRVMNTAPRGDLEMEDFNITAEQLRQGEQHMQATGRERWTAYVRHRTTGSFAGFTELVWNPNRPETVGQDGTGVFPEHRGHGLGKWLKAAMLERLLRERPSVKDVRTGNADSNAPMLKINTDLGFKPYISNAAWQVPVETVRAYLQRRA